MLGDTEKPASNDNYPLDNGIVEKMNRGIQIGNNPLKKNVLGEEMMNMNVIGFFCDTLKRAVPVNYGIQMKLDDMKTPVLTISRKQEEEMLNEAFGSTNFTKSFQVAVDAIMEHEGAYQIDQLVIDKIRKGGTLDDAESEKEDLWATAMEEIDSRIGRIEYEKGQTVDNQKEKPPMSNQTVIERWNRAMIDLPENQTFRNSFTGHGRYFTGYLDKIDKNSGEKFTKEERLNSIMSYVVLRIMSGEYLEAIGALAAYELVDHHSDIYKKINDKFDAIPGLESVMEAAYKKQQVAIEYLEGQLGNNAFSRLVNHVISQADPKTNASHMKMVRKMLQSDIDNRRN